MKLINLEKSPWSTVSHNPTIKKRIILNDGELKGISSLSQAIFRPGDVADAHVHTDMAEVFIVTSGRGVIRINGEEHALTTNVVVVAEPHEIHEIANTGDHNLIITYFGVRL